MKLFSEPRNLRETSKQGTWCLQHAPHKWRNKCSVDTESIFTRWGDWGSYTARPEWAEGWALMRRRSGTLLPTEGADHLFCNFPAPSTYLSLATAVLSIVPRHRLLPYLLIYLQNICQPPSKFLNRKWKSSWLPAATLVHRCSSCFPFLTRAFIWVTEKINSKKMLGNERDQEIEKSGEEDQNVYWYYSIERIK